MMCRGRVSISELKRKKVELSATSIMAFKTTNYIHLDMLSYLEISEINFNYWIYDVICKYLGIEVV